MVLTDGSALGPRQVNAPPPQPEEPELELVGTERPPPTCPVTLKLMTDALKWSVLPWPAALRSRLSSVAQPQVRPLVLEGGDHDVATAQRGCGLSRPRYVGRPSRGAPHLRLARTRSRSRTPGCTARVDQRSLVDDRETSELAACYMERR